MNPNETQKRRLPDYLKRLFTIKAMSVILIIALLIFGVIGWNKYLSLDNKTTSLGFENISEFATQAAYCTTVNTEEAARNIWGIEIPFTQSKYIYSYDSIIKAGFDFSQITWSVNDEKQIIRVTLPPVRILSHEIDLDSFKLYHEAESIFRQVTLDEHNAALTQMKKTAEQSAINNGLFEDAIQMPKHFYTDFCPQQYDLSQYQLEFSEQ